ncbi:MAG: hypothetical protein OXE84_14565 [Rhodobacteraceae bacterium]|nr:hypothetical protein [Paracoccaceae bacterium]MCY4327036.1 hypothetical protein [Paracoccaceae bacterium]
MGIILILSGIAVEDDADTVKTKITVIADFIDSWLNLRLWNYKLNSYSTMQYAIFTIIRSIRGKSLGEIRKLLYNRLHEEMKENDSAIPANSGLNLFGAAIWRIVWVRHSTSGRRNRRGVMIWRCGDGL